MFDDYEYKLSVVVLVYNTEFYLEECLDSLVNQTLDNIEIICVNDESTDNSLNILKKYAKEYDNIKIINQKNQGGAVAGNNGLKVAKGEYVTLVDSDDVVPLDAYEKLYNKAKETDSDIVGGMPVKYVNGYQRELSYKHNIWLKEKTIDIDEDFEIFYDVFYWNKIYRRELIEKHDIYMIPGKIYADVPLVFRAYLFANKISIIPDVVYYWRKRGQEAIIKGDIETSVSKSLLDISNMKDRLSTYYYLKDYFKEAGKEHYFNHVIKTYLERFFYPIPGILNDKLYEDAYIDEIKAIADDIDEIYDNNLRIIYNLYIYLILNDKIDVLKELLAFNKTERNFLIENGKCYWDVPYFRNSKYDIPDHLFEMDYIDVKTITIESFDIDSEFINISGIQIPDIFTIDEAELLLIGLSKIHECRNCNIFKYSLNKEANNSFSLKAPLNKIKNIGTFDVYLKFKYEGKDELFRINENNFENEDTDVNSENDNVIPFFSKLGNFSMRNSYSKNIFNMDVNNNGLIISQNNNAADVYRIFINHKRKNERVYFTSENHVHELIWKYSLDKNIEYKLALENKEIFDLTTDYFTNFEDKTIEYENSKIEISENEDKSISIILKD